MNAHPPTASGSRQPWPPGERPWEPSPVLGPKLQLPQLTLVLVEGRRQPFCLSMAAKALAYSLKGIDFGAVRLLAPVAPANLPPTVEFVATRELGAVDYSRFMIKELWQYVDTEFALTIQADGFVHNPAAWRPEFLNYDYIGAPWPHTTARRAGADITVHNLSEASRVGNGGFSLRSRKLLKATADLAFDQLSQFPEDFIICRLCQPFLASHGLTFAPVELAAQFAIELPLTDAVPDIGSCFGFHGRHFNPERALMSL